MKNRSIHLQANTISLDSFQSGQFACGDEYELILGAPFSVSRIGGIMHPHATPRVLALPNGEYLLMSRCDAAERRGAGEAPVGIFRSTDRGATWTGPESPSPWDETRHHQAVPFLDPDTPNTLFAFSNHDHPGPVFWLSSEDWGRTWSDRHYVKAERHPDSRGMAHMRGCVLDSGTWIWGIYDRKPKTFTNDRQYVLRSADKGQTWTASGPYKHGKWRKFLEGIVVTPDGVEALMYMRSCGGRFYQIRSTDDGVSWSEPDPVGELVHPDAPPMVFRLSDKSTLIAFHHNRYTVEHPHHFHLDRQELWFSRSTDAGRTWDAPRFFCANIDPDMRPLTPITPDDFVADVSYLDVLSISTEELHVFISYECNQLIQMTLSESTLERCPTRVELMKYWEQESPR